jgi:enamine deaminase RidA (YjgF/YER057c/UK114 family)
MAISCGDCATIFISGTASITNSETQHVGDVVAQTHETLDNIAALISEENLSRHGLPGLGASLDSLGMARVYIKRPADYAKARRACEKRLGQLPTIYAVANVCRPELLVEIEGIAFSRKPPVPLSDVGGPHLQSVREKIA